MRWVCAVGRERVHGLGHYAELVAASHVEARLHVAADHILHQPEGRNPNKISPYRTASSPDKKRTAGPVSRVLSVPRMKNTEERQPFVWPRSCGRGVERPTRGDSVGTDSPLPKLRDPPMLGLAPDRACLLPVARDGGLLPHPFTSHPVHAGIIGGKRAVFSLRRFPYPYGPRLWRHPVLRRPDFPLRTVAKTRSGCPALRPANKIIHATGTNKRTAQTVRPRFSRWNLYFYATRKNFQKDIDFYIRTDVY